MIDDELHGTEKSWATLCYLAAVIGYGLPFFNVVAPLVLWQSMRNRSEFVDLHGRESVNLQISFTVYLLVAALSLVVSLGMVFIPMVILWQMAMIALGAYNAYSGRKFQGCFVLRVV